MGWFSDLFSLFFGSRPSIPTPPPTTPIPQPPPTQSAPQVPTYGGAGGTISFGGSRVQPPAPVPEPVLQPPISPVSVPWQWVHPTGGSGGPIRQEGEWWVFDFAGYEPHQLLRRSGPITGTRIRLVWLCEGANLMPARRGNTAKVSLMITGQGNTDWSGPDRYYCGALGCGQELNKGGGTIDWELRADRWKGTFGESGVAFAQALANPQWIGLAFGDPDTGDTAHGVRGSGKFKFRLEIL